MKSITILAAALALSVPAPICHAGETAVNVRAFAQDFSVGIVDSRSAGTPASFQPTASATVLFGAGLASSYAHIDSSTYTGAIHADFQAAVGDTKYIVGRNANSSGSGGMTGSITLAGPTPPGLATFSAVLEGSYNFSNATSGFLNRISMDFTASVGDGPERNGTLTFDPFSIAGLFSIPMTWTQTVHPGQLIPMSFYLHATVDALVDAVELNALNTFKLTAIDLPAGYSHIPDEQGFLKDFASPTTQPPTPPTATAVPESGTMTFFGTALLFGLVLMRRCRRNL